MRIGVVGAGEIGGAFAERLIGAGHEVVVANSRGPETLSGLVRRLGGQARAGTLAEAASTGDVVVLAVPFKHYADLPPEPFEGRIVIDAGNYDIGRDGQNPALDSGETTSGEILAGILNGAKVVKAFNTIWYRRLRDEGRPDLPLAERLAIPVSGDDPQARAVVAALAEELGFAPVEVGTLADSRRHESGTPVFNQAVGPERARELLALVG